jgi:hypothetical protein
MTTKPKTRKPAAKTVAAPKAAAKQTPNGRPTQISEIERLIARHKFLWADQIYQSAVAATVEESNALNNIHDDEIDEIEDRLAVVVPESFTDVYRLLDFATEIAEQAGGRDNLEIKMLKNVRNALPDILRGEIDVAHTTAFAAARHDVDWAFEVMEDIRKRNRAEKLARPEAA